MKIGSVSDLFAHFRNLPVGGYSHWATAPEILRRDKHAGLVWLPEPVDYPESGDARAVRFYFAIHPPPITRSS